jgi:hypothetical protein
MGPARELNSVKVVANEGSYPNIVELAVGSDGLDFILGRRIMDFHKSRHIKPRHGRTTIKQKASLLPLVLFRFGNGSRLHR